MTFSLTASSVKRSGAMIFTLPDVDVGLVDDAAHAAVVIDMGVAVDNGDDRLLAEFLGDEIERGLRGLRRDQRVDDDPAGVALDEGDVGQVIAAHLVDAVGAP